MLLLSGNVISALVDGNSTHVPYKAKLSSKADLVLKKDIKIDGLIYAICYCQVM